jgi:hypothetical protein
MTDASDADVVFDVRVLQLASQTATIAFDPEGISVADLPQLVTTVGTPAPTGPSGAASATRPANQRPADALGADQSRPIGHAGMADPGGGASTPARCLTHPTGRHAGA